MEIRLWVEQGQVFEVEQGWAFELGKLALDAKDDVDCVNDRVEVACLRLGSFKCLKLKRSFVFAIKLVKKSKKAA
ncbi:hypothetical protein BH80429_12400 [Bartonella henselae]|nr:hypothetical protein BhenCHDE101_07195 [Bartonella henselae]PNM38952.1 hypothetical protein AL470_006500 [Bartonella henselae str. Houston-1]GFF02012.1 hypothetical protein BH623125_04460 [Bartonella henselae]GFF04419.1 hypothetical protein BH80429_12400 [Bartonella henselae]